MIKLTEGGNNPHAWSLPNLEEPRQKRERERRGRLGLPPEPLSFYSILPTGPIFMKVFVLDARKKLWVWNVRGTWDAKQGYWRIRNDKRAQEIINSLFFEPFYVFD